MSVCMYWILLQNRRVVGIFVCIVYITFVINFSHVQGATRELSCCHTRVNANVRSPTHAHPTYLLNVEVLMGNVENMHAQGNIDAKNNLPVWLAKFCM